MVFGSGWTCGQPAPERVEDQVELALENARRELVAAGTDLGNVVKTFFLLTALEDYGAVRKAETEFYERHAPQLVTSPPAATLMVVPALARPELRVLYEVVAALDRADVTYYAEYWGGKELAYPHVPKEHAKFARSQAIGNLLVVSGCQALDHDSLRVETSDVAEQSRIVLDKVRVAVEEVGGSFADVVKTNVFVKDLDALATYRAVEREVLRGHVPATSAFMVDDLPRHEFLVEVEAFAVTGETPAELVFTPACTGRDITEALRTLDGVLSRSGVSMRNVVKLTVAMLDADDHLEAESAVRSVLKPGTATTFMQVGAINPAGDGVQVDAVALGRTTHRS